jgi:ureidoglycolate dehydrogenase (NAD+)
MLENIVNTRHLSADALKAAFATAFAQIGVRDNIARPVVDGLVGTSLRGVDSHGVELFPHYVAAVKGGRINPEPKFGWKQLRPAAAALDADHTFGHAAADAAMRRAIEMAREAGVACVSIGNSTHSGAAACSGLLAPEQGMIGLSFTGATPHVLYPGGRNPMIGPDPICFTAPMDGEEPFCLDMATTAMTFNGLKRLRQSGGQAQPGAGADSEGRPTTDPFEIVHLLPIGGYKGFGLAMMIDILCGLLSGMPVGPDVTPMYGNSISDKRRLGQFCMAIDIVAFEDPGAFRKRLRHYCDVMRNQAMRDESVEAMVPNDREKKSAAVRRRAGIPVSEALWTAVQPYLVDQAV